MATPNLSKKICLLGSFSVGKTSLVRRFVYDMFEDKYMGTIGVKVSRKQVLVPHGASEVQLTMLLWDMADSDEFDQIRPISLLKFKDRFTAHFYLFLKNSLNLSLVNFNTYVNFHHFY